MTTQLLSGFGMLRYAETAGTNPDFDGEDFRHQWSNLVGSLHRHWQTRELVLCYSGRNPHPANILRLKALLETDPRNVGSVLAVLDERTRKWNRMVLSASIASQA